MKKIVCLVINWYGFMQLSGEVLVKAQRVRSLEQRALGFEQGSKHGGWWKCIFCIIAIWGELFFFAQAQEVDSADTFLANGQEWKTANSDTFFIDQNKNIFFRPLEGKYALGFQSFSPPFFSRKYWIDTDIWLSGQPQDTDVYYVFSTAADSGETPVFFAAGYSLAKRQMEFGKLQKGKNGVFSLGILESKPVEIRDERYKYVFRIIFNDETNELIFEVNGVPMTMLALFSQNAVRRFGFLFRGNPIRIEPLRIDGRS